MASSMPEIGSKISLISKADIRYEGKLFTVDPNECTIALSHVRSYGTEDRQTQFPVPAQTQVYEYILFRGSDIKDISIVNTQHPLPNDPAIVSGGMAPNMGSSYPSHSYSHPVIGGTSAPVGTSQPYSYMAPGMGRNVTKQMSSELGGANVPEKRPAQAQVSVQVIPIVKEPTELLAGGSRSSTPSLSRKSPTNDQGTQVSPRKDRKVVQPPVPRDGQQNRTERSYQEMYQRRDYRQRDSQGENYRGQRDDQRNDYRGQREDQRSDYRGQKENNKDDYRQRDNQRERIQEHRGGPDNRRDNYLGHQQQRQGMGQGPPMNRGGWIQRGGRGAPGPAGLRGRGRGGPGANFNRAPGTSGQSSQQNNPNATKKNTLKFDEEYDFDKANSEFEELKNKTAKLKISGEGEPEKPKVNGEDKKDDSGNETGLGEGEPEEAEEPEAPANFYDKTKSFFDNISCEAVERSKGRSQRTDWRTERKLNSETFGVASARRGAYRGRGGYYGGRGMYRGYRGYNMRGQGRGHINQPRPQLPQAIAVAK